MLKSTSRRKYKCELRAFIYLLVKCDKHIGGRLLMNASKIKHHQMGSHLGAGLLMNSSRDKFAPKGSGRATDDDDFGSLR